MYRGVPPEVVAAIMAESVGQQLLPNLMVQPMEDIALLLGVRQGSPLIGILLRCMLCQIIGVRAAVLASPGLGL